MGFIKNIVNSQLLLLRTPLGGGGVLVFVIVTQ